MSYAILSPKSLIFQKSPKKGSRSNNGYGYRKEDKYKSLEDRYFKNLSMITRNQPYIKKNARRWLIEKIVHDYNRNRKNVIHL